MALDFRQTPSQRNRNPSKATPTPILGPPSKERPDHQIRRHNARFAECPGPARQRSVGRGFLETVNRTISSVTRCYMAEPGWLGGIEIEVVEAALSLPGLDQMPP